VYQDRARASVRAPSAILPQFPESERTSWYVNDTAPTDRVLSELQDDGSLQMIMAISIHGHGRSSIHRSDAGALH
jgi:hypothetical protein